MGRNWTRVTFLVLIAVGAGAHGAEQDAKQQTLLASAPKVSGPTEPGDAAITQPAAKGTLEIRGVQGTRNGAPIGVDPVTVDIYAQGSKLLKTIETTLDIRGQVTVDIPVEVMCQPVVHVLHGGISYEGVGRVMDRTRRVQQMEMTLYEPTDRQPALTIDMRHVLVHYGPQGLHVTEMLAITNPGDRTWVGVPASGKRSTLVVQLPAAARDVAAPTAAPGDVELHDGKLVVAIPMFPGSTQLQIDYTIPSTGGRADLTIASPLPVEQMHVFIPEDGATVTVAGLDATGVRATGEGNKRTFRATALKAGQEATLSFSDLHLGVVAGSQQRLSGRPAHLLPIAACMGGGLVLLGCVTALLVRTARKGEDCR